MPKQGTSKFCVTWEQSFGADPQPLYWSDDRKACEAYVNEMRHTFSGKVSIVDGAAYPHERETV